MLVNPQEVWLSTAWSTAADVSSTGTAVVQSAFMYVVIPSVDIVEWLVEVDWSPIVTAGAPGDLCYSWCQLSQFQGDVSVADNAFAGLFYTGKSPAGFNVVRRTARLRPSVFVNYNQDGPDSLGMMLRANASGPAVSFTVSNIRCRLRYKVA